MPHVHLMKFLDGKMTKKFFLTVIISLFITSHLENKKGRKEIYFEVKCYSLYGYLPKETVRNTVSIFYP